MVPESVAPPLFQFHMLWSWKLEPRSFILAGCCLVMERNIK